MMEDLAVTYRRIGRGCCGSVWTDELEAPNLAIKRGDASELRSVKIDSDIQRLILQRFKQPNVMVPINIPYWYDFIAREDVEKWAKYKLTRFPAPNRILCDALATERLLPFDWKVCSSLISLYCPEPIRIKFEKTAREVHPNCILRLYLGKRHKPARESRLASFTLNNLPLWIDRAQSLGLDTLRYAQIMGGALALLHWVAGIDADDVEWVLAPSRAGEEDERVINCKALGRHSLWVIDFDCCKVMELSEAGVQQAVKAFFKNDPYYPQPQSDGQDQELWDTFKEAFLQTSHQVLAKTDHHFADLWVKSIELEARNRLVSAPVH